MFLACLFRFVFVSVGPSGAPWFALYLSRTQSIFVFPFFPARPSSCCVVFLFLCYDVFSCCLGCVIHLSGTKQEPKPKLFGPDIFGWGGGLPHKGVGAKKFGMSFETQGKQTF